ncbi:hypothetical protein [Pseudomonas siliginis]|uniref:hypothetical protein n=1 Tax=Pseudomonas siliginis TaxID=2842346 RepID=UPI002093384C|nr:hypothetical protein [Pseudomonas siliginis]UST96766.1 hypothetical protein NF679_06570 [Pseudomonas siliginis]
MPSVDSLADALNHFIPHSLGAIEALNIALRLQTDRGDAQPMKILINDELTIEGNSNAFTNAAIEAGVMHRRALLEFLGLTSASGRLQNLTHPRRGDDIGIEHFENASGFLTHVSLAQVLSRYPGDAAEAEQALLSVFRIANKGLAHLTSSFLASSEETRPLEIASRGIPALVVSYFYTPMGRPAPAPQVSSRPRHAD